MDGRITPYSAPETADGIVRLDFARPGDGAADWALWRPGSRVCVVVLHGHGSRGDQLFTRPDIRDAWLPRLLATGAAILAPDLGGNHWMGPAAVETLRALLAWCRQQGAGHFVFFSGSMGGTSNLIYGALHPEDVSAMGALCPATDLARFADWCAVTDAANAESVRTAALRAELRSAIVAAYGGTPRTHPETYAAHSACRHAARLTMPLFIVHGRGDPLIPVEESRALVASLGHARNLTYREMDGGHDAPLFHPEALDWIVGQIHHFGKDPCALGS